ncbi:MAG: class I SAM-dependent methyltransferase, partial [Lactococcus garvieae]
MINLFSSALENNYILNKDKNIYHREGFSGINYSDGSAIENNILDIVKTANDVSIHSDELRSKCTTWETTYHFSPVRTNILRPFEKRIENSTVLEIGAGCGAITRYLGECGAQVHALEGSMKRAEIARARTRDLENVHIVSDNFEDYSVDFKYDIITLIGVLEYAPLFIKGESPVKIMLERVRTLLKDDGILIIAIENQLGLKYFAGCPEDHKWRVMYGIEGRYSEGDAITFGRKRLNALIREAGYESIDFMAAFPDYKMPNTIISEFGFQCESFNSTALVTENVTKDYQLAETLYLSQELAWPVINDNGLSLDLANSFL